jgi:hypothetical protein
MNAAKAEHIELVESAGALLSRRENHHCYRESAMKSVPLIMHQHRTTTAPTQVSAKLR